MPWPVALDSRTAYTALVALVALERLLELRLSSRNAARGFARGGVEAGRWNYACMVAVHALFLLACPAEVWLLDRRWRAALGVPALLAVGASMTVRYWVVRALEGRWTTRVVYVPGDPLVRSGPFRYVRHPNYLAVLVEIAALPLVHGAWLTAAAFSAANALVLARRVILENRLLARLAVLASARPPRARTPAGEPRPTGEGRPRLSGG